MSSGGGRLDQNITDYLVQELLPALEDLDAKSAAILLFLKDRGMATDDALKPYMEQAAMGSSVRWRAVRARIEHLLAAPKSATGVAGKQAPKPKEKASDAGKEAQLDAEPKSETQRQSAGEHQSGPESKSHEQPKAGAESRKASDQDSGKVLPRIPAQNAKSADKTDDGTRAKQASADKGGDNEDAGTSRPRESAARRA
jgi:hypothetical protein